MGLFSWVKNKSYPPALIADNAQKQYKKGVCNKLGDSPAEIAELMWTWRYMNATLDAEGERRLSHYSESEFPIITVMDFCLGSFDIEFLFSPRELNSYSESANYIDKELQKNGVPCFRDDISSFIEKWDKLIYPLR